MHLVHLTDSHSGERNVPDGVVGTLDAGDGWRGAVLRPHFVDEDDGAHQSHGAHQCPQRPEDKRVCTQHLTQELHFATRFIFGECLVSYIIKRSL